MAVASALGAAACSTTYQPQPTGRVAAVIHGGAAMYVTEGREVPIGPFSSRLELLVADTPDAAAHAHAARTDLMVGVPIYGLGTGALLTSILVLSGPVGWAVIGAGAIAAGTGLGFMGKGFTHLVDAMNIHNDAVSGGTDACVPRAPQHETKIARSR